MSADRPLRKTRGGSIDKAWEDEVRRKIQQSKIVNRLISYINGEISLVPAQVTAALGLLRKTLPDLAQVEHSGELTHNYVARLPQPVSDVDEWKKQTEATLQ